MTAKLIVSVMGTAVLLWTAGLSAAPFERKEVGGEAQWVLHVDLDKIRASQLGDYLIKASKEGPLADKLTSVSTELGFDPMKDLSSVTAYGKSVPGVTGQAAKPEMAAVMHGKFDLAKLGDTIRQRPGFEAAKYGKYELLKVMPEEAAKAEPPAEGAPAPEKPQESWVCLLKPDLIVVGGEAVAVLQRALDVLDGQRESLVGGKTFTHLAELEQAPLFLAAANLNELGEIEPQAAMLREASAVSVAVREVVPPGAAPAAAAAAATLDLLVIVDAKTDEAATQMKQFIDGMVAMVKMNAQQQPGLGELTDKLKTAVEGRQFKLTFSYPVKDLLTKIEQMKAAKPVPPEAEPAAPPAK